MSTVILCDWTVKAGMVEIKKRKLSYFGNTLEDRRKLLRERNNTKHNFRSLKKRKIKYILERQYYQWTGIKRDLLVRSAEDGTRWQTISHEAANPLIKSGLARPDKSIGEPSARGLVVDEETWARPLHGWLGDRKDDRPAKTTLHYSPEVLFWTAWRRTRGKSG